VVLPWLSERTQVQYGVAETTSESETAEDEGWGSRPNDEGSTSVDSPSPTDSSQSSFIGQAASGSATTEEEEKETRTPPHYLKIP